MYGYYREKLYVNQPQELKGWVKQFLFLQRNN